MKTATAITLAALPLAALGLGYAVAYPASPAGCRATQPVYSTSYQKIGTWQATIPTGQSAVLPDGDQATCTPEGTVTITGQDGVNRITGTTRQPTCAELAAQYGDDQFCAASWTWHGTSTQH